MEVTEGFHQTEAGVLPKDWDFDFAENLAYITTGSKNTQDRIEDGEYPFFVRSQIVERINTYSFDGEAVLTAGDGVGTGKVFHYIRGKFDTHQRVYRISHFDDRVNGFYFFLYFSSHFYGRIMQMTAKSSVDSVRREMIAKMLIPYPRVRTEQDAIAECVADTEAFIKSLERLVAKKRALKQGAMDELLVGKRRLPGFSAEWRTHPFGEVARLRKERVDPRSTGAHDFCVELEHIEQGTGRLLGHNVTDKSSSLKSVFKKDDVLFGKLRAYLRKYWLATREGVCSTEIWVLIARQPVLLPEYLAQVVKTDSFVEAASSAYGTHMPRSDWSVTKNYEVHFPAPDEQSAIAAVLSEMDEEIAQLEAKLEKARLVKQGMMQELLTGRIRLA